YGVRAARTPAVRAAAPRLRGRVIRRTPGNPAVTASAVPSEEALSTTMIAGSSGSAVRLRRVRTSSGRRSWVAITTVTGAPSRSPTWALGTPPAPGEPAHPGMRAEAGRGGPARRPPCPAAWGTEPGAHHRDGGIGARRAPS